MALAADPIKTGKMELIWLKPTARSPALMLCTESVWFWSSEQFTERAALGNFYLSFGLQDLKIVLDKDPAKSCEMESIWLKLTARFPALVLCTESVWFWSSKRFAERAALGNFYLSFGLQGEKIVLDTASAKHCEMAHIGWNQQPAPQLLCYVQSQCGSEVPNNLLKGPPWQLLFVLWFTRWENCPWYGSCKKLWDGIHLVETNGLLPSSYAVYRVSVVLKFQTICWKGRPWQLLFVLWLSLIQLLQNIA